jgi:hypothetical protein
MAFVHGHVGEITVDDNDLSVFCTSITPKRSADSHDVTTFGKTSHVYAGGLFDGTLDIEGIYDNGATGPKTVLEPLLGTTVAFEYRPEGTGSGKPEQTGNVLVASYEESTPVADMITWKASLQLSDTVSTADQT